jgi:hypothetical protein
MFPEVTERDEVVALQTAVKHGVRLIGEQGAFGDVSYSRELDLTLDRRRGRFRHVEDWREDGFVPGSDGSWQGRDSVAVPVIEGRMVGGYDFFQKSWVAGKGRSAKWRANEDAGLAECQPQFLASPRQPHGFRLAICDVTSATNTRTMLATWVPPSWPCGNTAPVLMVSTQLQSMALLALLNSMVFDWVLRRLVAGLHLNRFYLESVPVPLFDEDELRVLAAYAMRHTVESPRYRELLASDQHLIADLNSSGLAHDVDAAARIEALIGRAYGFTGRRLAYVLRDERSDRRGLWRFYAAEPAAHRVAKAAVALLDETAKVA